MYGGGELLAVLAGSIRQIWKILPWSSEGCRSCGSERDSPFSVSTAERNTGF